MLSPEIGGLVPVCVCVCVCVLCVGGTQLKKNNNNRRSEKIELSKNPSRTVF
jgi:hypothetical protein